MVLAEQSFPLLCCQPLELCLLPHTVFLGLFLPAHDLSPNRTPFVTFQWPIHSISQPLLFFSGFENIYVSLSQKFCSLSNSSSVLKESQMGMRYNYLSIFSQPICLPLWEFGSPHGLTLFLTELHPGIVTWFNILKNKLNTSFLSRCILAKILRLLL